MGIKKGHCVHIKEAIGPHAGRQFDMPDLEPLEH